MNNGTASGPSPSQGRPSLVKADLTWSHDSLSGFFALLSRGFMVKALLPANLRSTLNQLGIAPEFISDRIQAVFLDGIPTVDLDTKIVMPGSTVALSTAITEQYMAFTFITGRDYCEGKQVEGADTPSSDYVLNKETFTLKLFNMLSRMLGPHFLELGIVLRAEDLGNYLRSRTDSFWSGFLEGTVDELKVNIEYLRGLSWLNSPGQVQLKVDTRP